jgi:hypothetical protein
MSDPLIELVPFVSPTSKRHPEPPAWFVGEAGGQMVPVLLSTCGVDKAR